jgi:SAM-dependent methyltransferase
MADKR